jgi:hypothetical protein
MAFKLGKRSKQPTHIGGVNVVTTPLDKGALAEARNDGTIAISPDVDQTNKKNMNRIIKHEMKHMRDMQEGRAAYGDNWMMWDGNIYIRKDGKIDGPNGRWPEGHPNHPWEQEAMQAENE